MKKRKKIWALSIAIALLALIVIASINSSRRNTVAVQTAVVERRETLESKVTASGELRAKQFVDLQPEISGIITELYVHEGDSVKKGEVLLRIDPIQTDEEFEIANAEINLLRDETSLRSAQAELDRAENNFEKTQRTFKRNQELYEDGLISREDYEKYQNEFIAAQSSVEVQKANVASMEKAIEISQNNIARMKTSVEASQARLKQAAANLTKASDQSKKSKIESPLDGVITSLDKEQGERAVPGMMSNPEATIMTIADLSVIQAEIKVDETDVVNVSLGDKTEVQVDALPDVIFEGEVTEIGNSPIQSSSAAQEAKDFKVIVTLKNASPKLRPGMSCTSEITTDVKTNALVIPIQALTVRDVEVDEDGQYIKPDADNKKEGTVARADSNQEEVRKKELEGVFVVDKEMTARFRPVDTGITGESEIEVLGNLKEGEEIIAGSFQTLRTIKDGAAVKIEKRIKAQSVNR